MVPVEDPQSRLSATVIRTVATDRQLKWPDLKNFFDPKTFPVFQIIACLRHNSAKVIELVGNEAFRDALRSEEILIAAVQEAPDPESNVMIQRIRELTYLHTMRVLELIVVSETADDLRARINNIGIRLQRVESVNAVLERRVKTDPLTKLYNKEGLKKEGEKVFEYCKTNGIPLSCLYVDLDYFKIINDRYGHDVGDAILKAFSRIIAEEFRDYDVAFKHDPDLSTGTSNVIGRDGGEEFVVLLPYTDLAEAAMAAERLRKRLQNHSFSVADATGKPIVLDLTCTIGVSQADFDKDENAEVLKKHSDNALKSGKNDHRNVVSVRSVEEDSTSYEYPSLRDTERRFIHRRARYYRKE